MKYVEFVSVMTIFIGMIVGMIFFFSKLPAIQEILFGSLRI